MKKKKFESEVDKDGLIEIGIEESGEHYFEIGNEITKDVAEAVSLMMRIGYKLEDNIWDTKIPNCLYNDIDPTKCLYWLTGGNDEWKKLDHYKKTWASSCDDFGSEFGGLVISIVKKSKTLGDMRNFFIKDLSLPKLYDFAIDKNLI